MANFEPIELSIFPLWQHQQGESEISYDHFYRYFLPIASGNLVESYRKFKQDLGENTDSIDDAGGSWKDECRRYRWRERHRAYWRYKAQEDMEWRQEQERRLIEQELALGQMLINRARDLLERDLSADDRLKDATSLLRSASELSRKALGIDDRLEKAILVCTRAGLEVSDPALAGVLNGMGVRDDGK